MFSFHRYGKARLIKKDHFGRGGGGACIKFKLQKEQDRGADIIGSEN